MFIGEFGCVLPLLYQCYGKSETMPDSTYLERILARLPIRQPRKREGYQQVASDEGENVNTPPKVEIGETLAGWRMLLMWFPAFFDSKSLTKS
jgi:hypothetical protein